MKKILITLVIEAIVIVGGGWYGKNLVAQKVSTKVTAQLDTPSGQKVLRNVLQSKKVQAELAKAPSDHTTVADGNQTLHFANEQQAIQFALGRISPMQLIQFIRDYQNRGSFTPGRKKDIEKQVLAYFTLPELEAMAKTVHP